MRDSTRANLSLTAVGILPKDLRDEEYLRLYPGPFPESSKKVVWVGWWLFLFGISVFLFLSYGAGFLIVSTGTLLMFFAMAVYLMRLGPSYRYGLAMVRTLRARGR